MSTLQLLIIGNGFDLHCGLKSSYRDFFRSAILNPIGGELALKRQKAQFIGFWENLLIKYYECNQYDNYSWCDIESIIKKTLEMIYVKSEHCEKGLWTYALYATENNIDLNNSELDFSIIEEYILECCLLKINEAHRRSSYDDRLNLLNKYLQSELKKLEKRFCKYLKNNIDNLNNESGLNEKYIVNAANLLAQITEFTEADFSDMDDIIDNHEEENEIYGLYDLEERFETELSKDFNNLCYVNILSFNYTNLFDILNFKSPCRYSNVHGKLCNNQCNDNCSSSNVIFGIDDSVIQSQGVDSNLRLFSKTYRKMLAFSDPINILPPKDKIIEIKFYGHSLSEADHSYFQSIFDYYDLYSNNNVSLIFYYSKGYENYDAVYKLINKYGETLNNKDQGNNLLHKLLLENRLKIAIIHDQE